MRVPYIWLLYSIVFIGILGYTDIFKIDVPAGRAILWVAALTFACIWSEGIARKKEIEDANLKNDKNRIEEERKNAIQKASRNY
jgi:hypothetical protein